MTKQQTILAEADSIVNGQRREDYGGPFESFSDIAKGWSMVLGTEVTPEQVGLCMIQLKVARAKNGGFHRDSFVDIAGYAQCMEFIAEHRASQEEPVEDFGRLDRVTGHIRPITSSTRFAHPNGRVCEKSLDPPGWFIVSLGGNEKDYDFRANGSWCRYTHPIDEKDDDK